jgi:hypothetical protein
MAQRAKAKKAAPGAGSAARASKASASDRRADRSASGAPTCSGEDPVQRLEAECRALRAELKTARAEIARLEKRQELVVNRIDWVIDSLHNLLEDVE